MKKKLVALCAILCVFTSGYGVLADTVVLGEDITEYVSIDSSKLLYKNGEAWEEVFDGITLKYNQHLKMEIKWQIPSDKMEYVHENSYFTLKLPSNNLKINTTDWQDLYSSNGITKLGQYRINSNKTVTVVLNDVAANSASLKNGTFEFNGYSTSSGDKIQIDLNDVTYIVNVQGKPSDSDSYIEYKPSNNNSKYVGRNEGSNRLWWVVQVNAKNGKAWYESRINGTDTGPTINNVLLEDVIEEGLSLDKSTLRINLPIHLATSKGLMSSKYLSINISSFFKEFVPTSQEGYDEFVGRIQADGKPSYGIYNNGTNDIIVVYFGNIPNEDVVVPKNDADLKTFIMSNSNLQEGAQLDDTIKGSQGRATMYHIQYYTTVVGGDKQYTNTAKITSDGGIDEKTIAFDFTEYKAGVEPIPKRTLILEKKDDLQTPLKNVQFTLFKLTVDGPKQIAILRTGEDGQATIENLDYGTYKLVEDEGQIGYGTPLYLPSDTFDITEEDPYGIRIEVINPIVTDVSGTKTWDDDHDHDRMRPNAIILDLYAGNDKVEGVSPVWNKEGDVWSYTFKNLPKYNDGKEIEYTVKEQAVPGYTTAYEGLNIINHHTPETTSVKGSKTWIDDNNIEGFRPNTITLRLYQDKVLVEGVEPTWTLKDENTWEYEFNNLIKYSEGVEIEYTVEEVDVEGYVKSQDGYDITNTRETTFIDIHGSKQWIDNQDALKLRPKSIKVELYVNDELIENLEPTWITIEGDQWTFVFKELPKYRDGQELMYTVKELPVDGYETSIEGTVITNTLKDVNKPTDPIDPVDPVDPIDPIEPVKPVQPVEPIEPVEPVKPVQPVEPIEPVEPTNNPKQVVPILPGTGVATNNTSSIVLLAGLSLLCLSHKRQKAKRR